MENAERRFKRLEAFEMWLCRRIRKVKWTEHKMNEDVLKMAKKNRVKTKRERQDNLIRHVL